MSVTVEISYGELIDKLSILEIKFERITDGNKRRNVARELASLNDALLASGIDPEHIAEIRDELKAVNKRLWEIEDKIREKEREQHFDETFIELARSVYQTNDRRAELKRGINERLGSNLVEEKSYQAY